MSTDNDYGLLCNRIFGISEGIVAAGVIISDQHVVYKTSESFQAPQEKDRLMHMLKQSYIMINEPSENEDYFGKVRYVMIHHEIFDVFLFRFISDPTKILVIIASPSKYEHSQLVKAITHELLASFN